MRIMAIDYGDAHTGVAISDPTGLLAGYTTTVNAYTPENIIAQLRPLIEQYHVEQLVLAAPKIWMEPKVPGQKKPPLPGSAPRSHRTPCGAVGRATHHH